jgi:hypothetical protein
MQPHRSGALNARGIFQRHSIVALPAGTITATVGSGQLSLIKIAPSRQTLWVWSTNI